MNKQQNWSKSNIEIQKIKFLLSYIHVSAALGHSASGPGRSGSLQAGPLRVTLAWAPPQAPAAPGYSGSGPSRSSLGRSGSLRPGSLRPGSLLSLWPWLRPKSLQPGSLWVAPARVAPARVAPAWVAPVALALALAPAQDQAAPALAAVKCVPYIRPASPPSAHSAVSVRRMISMIQYITVD